MSLNLKTFKEAFYACVPPEQRAEALSAPTGKYLFTPGEYIVELNGLEAKTSKAGKDYFAVTGKTDSGATANIMLSLFTKEGKLNEYTMYEVFFKAGRRVSRGVCIDALKEQTIPLLSEILKGPWKIKVYYDLPYVTSVERNVWRIIDNKTGQPVVNADFATKEQATEAATKPVSEGGMLGLKLGSPQTQLVGPADGYKLPETILEILTFLENEAEGKSTPEPVAAKPSNPFALLRK